MQVVEQAPGELGDESSRWTAERLATYLGEKTEIHLSGMQVRRILKQKKYGYLWAKYSLEDRQDAIERKAFRDKLAGELAASEQDPAKPQVWFWDESGFSLRVIRRKCWDRKGQGKTVTGKRGRG